MARILVIEDDAQVRDMLKEVIERSGHEVLLAQDGAAGLREFNLHGADLIVTDVVMPQIGGVDTIVAIKNLDPNAKIIAMSGGSADLSAESCLEFAERIGADRVFNKPLDRKQLTNAINELLGS